MRSNKVGDLSSGKIWMKMDGPTQEHCRSLLLGLFHAESDQDVKHKLCDAVAEVARAQAEYGEWSELLALLLSVNAGTEGFLAVGCLRILAAVPEILEARPDFNDSSRLIQGTLMHSDAKVKLESLRALSSIFYVFQEERESQIKAAFQPIIDNSHAILGSFFSRLNIEDEVKTESILAFVEMVQEAPKLFRNCMKPLVLALIEIARSQEAEQGIRESALELILTLVECLGGKAKKDRELLGKVVYLLLELVAEVGADQAEWCKTTPDDEDGVLEEEEAMSQFAEQGLDRISMDLGGESLVPHFFTLIPQLLGSPDWKHKYAALRALASVAEGCMDSLEDQLDSVLSLIWPSFSDPNPRVQHAACHALGQLCTDFDGAIQERHAERSLTALVGVLVGSTQARVQAHAAAALINFAEGVEPAIVAPFLDEILSRLVTLLSTPVIYLQSQLMASIAAFSGAAGPAFAKYYTGIVPLLMGCLVSPCDPTDKERRQLQCRALEAITLVFNSIGREHVQADDLNKLVQQMILLQQSEMADDDEMIGFLGTSWVRVCQVMGQEFASLLPVVLPNLLAQASQDADMAVLEADDSTAQYDPEEWEFATVRGKKLGIRTSTLESKLEAIEQLALLIETLQSEFLPFAGQTYQAVLPLLAFDLHEGIQAGSAEVLVQLLTVMWAADKTQTMPAIQQVTTELVKSFSYPSFSIEYTFSALDALADILALTSGLGDAFLQHVFTELPNLLKLIIRCMHEKLQAAVDEEEDDDAEVLDDCEDEEGLLYALSRFTASLFRSYGSSVVPLASDLVNFCSKSIQAKETSPSMKHACLCILDDLVHWTAGAAGPAFAEPIAKSLLAALKETPADSDVRQAALFGVGMCAEHGGPAFTQFIIGCLPLLLTYLRAGNARAPSQMEVTDNAVSAIGRILLANPNLADPAILAAWLPVFPVISDEDEIIPAYRALLLLARSGAITDANALKAAIEPLMTSAKAMAVLEADPALRSDLASLIQ